MSLLPVAVGVDHLNLTDGASISGGLVLHPLLLGHLPSLGQQVGSVVLQLPGGDSGRSDERVLWK